MIAIAALALTVSAWLSVSTFGDPTTIVIVARVALSLLIAFEVERQAVPA